ncbi:MAG TPA: DVUA0089 family protein, partial [Polyangiaceae bacterium]|nr:DVUA0089 family protein [Polyangiaceae bacterium]
GEQCEDGNTTAGDGCSATCQVEAAVCSEVEPNQSIATATPITASCTDGGYGAIAVIGDQDYYAITVPGPASTIRAEVVGLNLTGCPTSFDSYLTLFNAAGTSLGTDDDDGTDLCSLISPTTDSFATNLAAGTYYIRVEEFQNDEADPPYILKVQVTP